MAKLLKHRAVIMAVVLLVLVMVLVISYRVSHKDSTPGDRSLALASPLTPDQLAKIDPELLAVIEREEEHPGEGQEVAPSNFVFDSSGRVECIVVLNPGKIVVTPMRAESEQWKNQAAVQLIAQYGGRVTMAYGHEVAGSIPLGQIKRLAQEDIVTSIFPNVLIRVPDRGPIVTATPSPPSPR